MTEKNKATLPKLIWKKTTCEICGKSFDYHSQKKPRICKSGDCRYKFHYKIKPESWASYQPTFFDQIK